MLLTSWRGVRLRKGTGPLLRWTLEPLVRLRLMTQLWPLVVLLAFLTLVPAAAVSEYQGEVIRVLDGDTIEVLHNQHPERIRLSGIDCPEKGQAYGQKAKQAASALVFGQEVTLQTYGKDKYRHTLADVLLPDGTDVNHALVKDGWCWWYRKYAPGDSTLEKLEVEAREAQRGLWADPHPVPPWETQGVCEARRRVPTWGSLNRPPPCRQSPPSRFILVSDSCGSCVSVATICRNPQSKCPKYLWGQGLLSVRKPQVVRSIRIAGSIFDAVLTGIRAIGATRIRD